MTAPPSEDDRTVIKAGDLPHSAVPVSATASGWPADSQLPGDTHTLPLGTRLGEFELNDLVGEGGFGIVYLAWDYSLDRKVAVKEYMPSTMASRVGVYEVSPRSQRHRETFQAGLRSFIKEAKLLAQFDHPSLVKVYRFWEANGTAYMAMPFYEGATLKDTVAALAQPPDEAWLLGLLAPLTEALNVIHAEHCYHRDIAPDNVILLAGSGKPLLLDFGAARRVIGDMTQAITVVLKPGYAPVEQYAEVPGMRQGPWTDVYALGAVVHWAITGKSPPPSVGRMLIDSLEPLAKRAAGRYSPRFLQAIDRALVVLPEHRTQTIDALRQDLGLEASGRRGAARPVPPADPAATVVRPPRTVAPPDVVLPSAAQAATIGVASAGGVRVEPRPSPRADAHDSAMRGALTKSTGVPVWLIAGVAILVLAAALWWALQSSSVPSEPAPMGSASAGALAETPVARPEPPASQADAPVVNAPPRPNEPAPGWTREDSPQPGPDPRQPAPDGAPGRPPEGSTKGTIVRAPPTPTPPKTDRRPRGAEAECAMIMQRLSLEGVDPKLLQRQIELGCR